MSKPFSFFPLPSFLPLSSIVCTSERHHIEIKMTICSKLTKIVFYPPEDIGHVLKVVYITAALLSKTAHQAQS